MVVLSKGVHRLSWNTIFLKGALSLLIVLSCIFTPFTIYYKRTWSLHLKSGCLSTKIFNDEWFCRYCQQGEGISRLWIVDTTAKCCCHLQWSVCLVLSDGGVVPGAAARARVTVMYRGAPGSRQHRHTWYLAAATLVTTETVCAMIIIIP